MKKIGYVNQLIAVAVLFSSSALADNDDGGRGGYGWGHHQHHGWGGYNGGYPAQQMNNYYPQPQGNYYYQQSPGYYQPQPQYYPQQPRYNYGGGYYQNRYPQGLAGGAIGNGKPLSQGIGTSAGPFIGNGSRERK